MVIRTRTHTAVVTGCTVKVFVEGVTPKQIDERNWGSEEAAQKDAKALMKLGGYK